MLDYTTATTAWRKIHVLPMDKHPHPKRFTANGFAIYFKELIKIKFLQRLKFFNRTRPNRREIWHLLLYTPASVLS